MAVEITVVVPFLDEERYIRRCVESLLAADYPSERVQFVFVDNGSTDRGPEIVREYPGVELLTVPEGRVYTARNAALEVAQGRVIAFTDGDCEVCPNWLQVIREETLERDATFVMGAIGFPKPRTELLDVMETYKNDHIEFVIENRIWQHVYGYTNNMAVRADVFRRLGPFEELPVPGDTDIVHRCLRHDPETRIVFRRDMQVDHLELVNARTLFRKIVDYGEFETHMPLPRVRVSEREGRGRAEAHSLAKNDFSFQRRLLFWIAVHGTTMCFSLGMWRARLRRVFQRAQANPR